MKKVILSSLIGLCGLSLSAQNVLIGEGSLLRGRGYCEPSISINPRNPDNIVAGAVLDAVFYSTDGGETWTGDTMVSSFGVWGDPVLITDTAGHHYYLHLSDPTGENWSSEEILDRIVIQKSTDGGQTWSNGSFTGMAHPKDQDKHWAVVDTNTNAIYITWTQFDNYGSEDPKDESNILFSKSLDGGETWSEAIQVNTIPGNCLDNDSTTEGAVPAVGPDGTIYVTWGNRGNLYFSKSSDAGESWTEDRVIAQQSGGWDIDVPGVQRANGMPVTICDTTGSLYVNWVDDREGNYDVWVMRSDDRGDTWTDAIRVNDDTGSADQFFTWMCVDPVSNILYAVFYDRRDLEGNHTHVYLARSTDQGETWINLQISEDSFRTNPLAFFGDYNHISAYGGRVRPIWTRIEGLKMGVWTTLWEESKYQAEKD
ncbi:sialidase family protein [Croceimicrobium hydrocarbonivorans]|uniref:Exo-alpha-sialidase n=1 Tax=Croceimicrobium hydrocarbonivorans TaxID=2761580 RepID=A0A7H0VGZ3_9FLAO|nr:sialidase family protein [Croceimicrobium hydrocarbonivorans]QNR24991.1 exo-alpha-sialidase [Croceimicrobium hydrocarbonivorans]